MNSKQLTEGESFHCYVSFFHASPAAMQNTVKEDGQYLVMHTSHQVPNSAIYMPEVIDMT